MAYQDDIALMAHLMRRAGFGAGRDELEARVAKGYEATVEELLHPETQPAVDELYAAALSAGGIAARRAAADGQRQLDVSSGEHQAPAGREDGSLLAPCVRHRQLKGGQLRSAADADQALP